MKKNTHFCRLNLSKNNIGDNGVINLATALKKNKSIISVDISSNNINIEGAHKFFEILSENDTLININISSLEGLHRNRLGVKGAEAAGELLKKNRILTHLNIGDTSIGKEGLEYIAQGLANNPVLVFLDLSNNGFSHHSLEDFCNVLNTTKLKELIVSGNKIGNKGCEIIASKVTGNVDNHLAKLEMSACDFTFLGNAKIFESLENNAFLTYLNLDFNNIGPFGGTAIGKCFLYNNCLQHVSLNSCGLKDDGISKLCEGLSRNIGIKKLSLCKNFITDLSAPSISTLLKKNSALITLDLSYNFIKNKGGILIVNALKVNSPIENLYFTENSLKDEAGRILAEITRFKTNLRKIDLGMNPINLKYVKEIRDNVTRNNFNYKQLLSPRIRKEIEKLTVADYDLDYITNKIQDKIKEKQEFEEKIVKHKQKLESAHSEEAEKYQVIRTEFTECKEKSQGLSKVLEKLTQEVTKTRYLSEKEIRELGENIAYTAQDIKKIEKLSIL